MSSDLLKCNILKFFVFVDFRGRREGICGGGGERESERKRNIDVILFIYAVIGCFLYVPLPGIKPTTVSYPARAEMKHFNFSRGPDVTMK